MFSTIHQSRDVFTSAQFNLAWKLSLVIKNKASQDLLSSYDAERMPVVAEVLNLASELHAKAFQHIPSSAFQPPADFSDSSDPMFRSNKLLQLGVNYRWSPVVYDERFGQSSEGQQNPYGETGTKIRAGDRAPYVPDLVPLEGGQETNLFELIEYSHLLLIFPGSKEVAANIDLASIRSHISNGSLKAVFVLTDSSNPDVPSVPSFIDEQGISLDAYGVQGAESGTWVIIRPDGIIGAYGSSILAVKKYFTLIKA
jgi:hypothetical protein